MAREAIEVGLSEDEQVIAWGLYEQHGSIAEVARKMNVPYHHVRAVIQRDPIRAQDVRNSRTEEVAGRWEGREQQASDIIGDMLDMFKAMSAHVRVCLKENRELTDLTDPRSGKLMTPLQAVQWLMVYKQIDSVSKTAFVAAKIAEGLHAVLDARRGSRDAINNANPGSMTDEELAKVVADLESLGRPLPPAVRAWSDARQKRLPA